ncbi:MAG TPA: hypothetical protein VGS14_07740 [Actinomycetes bacterium]|jgi:two-component system sensor histidine kinase KdpD|nr:hypothetical protein [Actinomycetes bacterium]
MAADDRRRGRLKVFLGAAAGVGKTYAMLGEARDLKAAGVDVVIGYWRELLGQSIIASILRETDGVDVHIIADRGGSSGGPQR